MFDADYRPRWVGTEDPEGNIHLSTHTGWWGVVTGAGGRWFLRTPDGRRVVTVRGRNTRNRLLGLANELRRVPNRVRWDQIVANQGCKFNV